MKIQKFARVLTIALSLGALSLFVSCSGDEHKDGDGHDHDSDEHHEGDGHDHSKD